MKTKTILRQIEEAFKDYGINVDIQPAITTDSIYIRFDYGILGSLRIGDHPGKAKFHYKYEIGSHISKTYEFVSHTQKGTRFVRTRFAAEDVKLLITTIKLERWNKIMKYGKPNYDRYVEKASAA